MTMDLQSHVMVALQRMCGDLRGYTVVAGISGGLDSTVLLHVLASVQDKIGMRVIACHVHHGLRGEEAEHDAQFVSELAASLNVPCEVVAVDVPVNRMTRGESEEMAARRLRYQALAQMADHHGARVLITAHHEQDQVETILDHILRGTGVGGLVGMSESRTFFGEKHLIRPFLTVPRNSLECYAHQYGLSHVEDSTNQKPLYRRNRIRLELLPLIRERYNHQIDTALLKLAVIAKDEDDYLNAVAHACMMEGVAWKEQCADIATAFLSSKPIALQRRVVKLVLEYLANDMVWGFSQIEDIRELTVSGNGTVHLGHDWVAIAKYGMLQIKRSTHDSLAKLGLWMPTKIDWSSFFSIWSIRWQVTAEPAVQPERFSASKWEAWFVRQEQDSWWIRPWHVGDRIAPLGMSGTRLISDLFVDRKVPRELRRLYPVVMMGDEVLWVPGLCRSRHRLVTGKEMRLQRIVITSSAGSPLGNADS